MRKSTWIILLALAVLIVLRIAVKTSMFVVAEGQSAIVTQFGGVVDKPILKPGLYFKSPFVQEVNFLEQRVIEWDGDPNQVPTKDKLFIHVDTYARWRISDPLVFFQRLRDERSAQTRLDDILDGETRNAVAKHTLIEVIRTTNREPLVEEAVKASGMGGGWQSIETGRSKIAQEIFGNAQKRLTDLGIALLDIRFKRINYNNDVQRKIFDRMISERKQIAGKFQAEGQGEAARILGEKERDLKKAQSEAYRQVLEIRGKADASASEIYAKAYNQNPQACDFYQFLKTMETYQAALDANTTLILTPETDFFKYLKSPFTPAPAAK